MSAEGQPNGPGDQWGAPDNYGPLWKRACWDASDRERGVRRDQEPTAITRRMDQVQPERVSWLFPARVPLGKLTILEGDPGLGKSTLIADFAARVTRGEGLPGDPAFEPGAVLILSAEDGIADTVRPRLDAAGAEPTMVHTFEGCRFPNGDEIDFTFGDPKDSSSLQLLEGLIRRNGIQLVCIDVLVAYLSGARDAHRDHDIRRALRPLAALAEATNCAFLGVRHLRKNSGGSAIAAGGGSIGIAGAARSVLLVDRDPDDHERRILAMVKSNLAREAPSLNFALEPTPNGRARVVWKGHSSHTADSLTVARAEQGHAGEHRSKLAECMECVTGWLDGGPLERREVLELGRKQGFSVSTVERAARDLNLVSTTNGFGREKHSRWELPPFPSANLNSVSSLNEETLKEMEVLDGNEARLVDEERAIEREAIEHENDLDWPPDAE